MEAKDPWQPDETELARRDHRRQKLWRLLGVELPKWEDEALAPTVDNQLLHAAYDRKLSSEQDKEVSMLIVRFRSWTEAYCRIGLEKRLPRQT